MDNICIFGDSIVWGAHRLPSRLAWANLLRNDLESRDLPFRVYDLGIDRDTTKDLLKRIELEASARKASYIIFDIGVNDSVYRNDENNPETNLESFESNLNSLINIARKFCDKIMLVGLVKGDDNLTIPLPQSTTGKCYSKERVRVYDRIIKSVAEKNHLPFADVYEKLGDADFSDGLHPNEFGHKKMHDVISPAFYELLGISK